jgi:RNA binding exosome subunit
MLSHYMNNKGIHMTDEDERRRRVLSRSIRDVTCYKCGNKKGHYANKCPAVGTAMTMSCQLDQILSKCSNNSRPNRI